MRRALVMAVALLACACVPSRLEGYDAILCSGNRLYDQTGIAVRDREYGMFDFRSGFSYCSTSEYYCMRAPLLISIPRDDRGGSSNQTWEVEGIAFNYVRNDSGFRIEAVAPAGDLIPGAEYTSVFSQNGDLIEVASRSPDGAIEVHRVCYGRINLGDLFEIRAAQ